MSEIHGPVGLQNFLRQSQVNIRYFYWVLFKGVRLFYRGSGTRSTISEEFRQAFKVGEIQKQLDEWTNKAAQEGFRDLFNRPYNS